MPALLPVEVQLSILSYIFDPQSLAAVSRCCRAFRGEVWPRLFESIALAAHRAPPDEPAFHRIMPQVRYLKIHDVREAPKYMDTSRATGYTSLLHNMHGLVEFELSNMLFHSITDAYRLLSALPPSTQCLVMNDVHYNSHPDDSPPSILALRSIGEDGSIVRIVAAKGNADDWLWTWLQVRAWMTLRRVEYTLTDIRGSWGKLADLLTGRCPIQELCIEFCPLDDFGRDGNIEHNPLRSPKIQQLTLVLKHGHEAAYMTGILQTSIFLALTHITLDVDLAHVHVPIKYDWHDDDGEPIEERMPSLERVDAVFRSCPLGRQEAELVDGIGFLRACRQLGLLHTTMIHRS